MPPGARGWLLRPHAPGPRARAPERPLWFPGPACRGAGAARESPSDPARRAVHSARPSSARFTPFPPAAAQATLVPAGRRPRWPASSRPQPAHSIPLRASCPRALEGSVARSPSSPKLFVGSEKRRGPDAGPTPAVCCSRPLAPAHVVPGRVASATTGPALPQD